MTYTALELGQFRIWVENNFRIGSFIFFLFSFNKKFHIFNIINFIIDFKLKFYVAKPGKLSRTEIRSWSNIYIFVLRMLNIVDMMVKPPETTLFRKLTFCICRFFWPPYGKQAVVIHKPFELDLCSNAQLATHAGLLSSIMILFFFWYHIRRMYKKVRRTLVKLCINRNQWNAFTTDKTCRTTRKRARCGSIGWIYWGAAIWAIWGIWAIWAIWAIWFIKRRGMYQKYFNTDHLWIGRVANLWRECRTD